MNATDEISQMLGIQSAEEMTQYPEVYGQGGNLSFRRSITITKKGQKPQHMFIKSSDVTRSELKELQYVSNHYCRTECIFYGLMGPVLERIMIQYDIEPVFPRAFGHKINNKGTILVMEDMTKQGFSLMGRSTIGIDHVYCVTRTLARVQAAFWMARVGFNYSLDSVLFGGPGCPFGNAVKQSGMDFTPMVRRNYAYFTANISKFAKTQDDMNILLASISKFITQLEENPAIGFYFYFYENLLYLFYSYFYENVGKYVKSAEDEKLIRDCMAGFIHTIIADPMGGMPSLTSCPIGLIHGDLWFSNFMFKEEGDSMTCRLFDWQFWNVGLFGFDLGLLMVSSLTTEMMEQHVDKIPAEFYRTFKQIFEAKTGKSVPFSEEAALENMRHAFFFALFWVITSSSSLWDGDHLDVPSLLANVAFTIRANRIALPSGQGQL